MHSKTSTLKVKKTIIFTGFMLLTVTALVGCANQNQTNKTTQIDEFKKPDFGQPERVADMMGIVKSISGNEVTILKIERATEEERAARQAEAGAGTSEQKAPSLGGGGGVIHGMGGGMIGRAGGGDRTEADRIEMMKSRAIGEEKIMIPVGIRMLIAQVGTETNETPTMLEATLEDIKQDKILNIWLNKDVTDRQLAEFVFVR